ncbi:Basic form of pathogenesis-related protein 1 [Morella rubra]|uniref:Basic form of pathogenesis-related protein 1 n=1 Tax=Morella rubra TaxID=262757 RepID=A0A6A1V7A6_9ROSI|nr:Basic form of pathogenesis-related protein 1 [Morella rubra]
MGSSQFLLAICFIGFTLTHVSVAQNTHQDFLDAHNAARDEVGVGPLKWNHTLQAYARDYATKRINDCAMEHSMGPYSENLAGGIASTTAVEGVNLWVEEKKFFDYKSNSCVGGECRHYTQVIWRDTKYVGCARVYCKTGGIFIICDYDPPGNNDGERPY